MFVKGRILYIVDTQKFNALKIFTDLSLAKLIDKFFPGEDVNKLSKELRIFLNTLPSGTIFSKTINEGLLYDSTSHQISLPFFSSHIRTPLKCGEHVWIYEHKSENQEGDFHINSYWVSRVHGMNFTEDVNYTYNDRDSLLKTQTLLKMTEDLVKPKKAIDKKNHKEFRVLAKNSLLKPDTSVGKFSIETNGKEIDLIKSQITDYRKNCVPNVNSNSDDFVIQGSNNTIIKLTTDQSSNGQYRKNPTGSGEITISAGQGRYARGSYNSSSGFLFDTDGSILGNQAYTLYESSNKSVPLKISIGKNSENLKNKSVFNILDNFSNPDIRSEGAFNIKEDASRISITENYNYSHNFNDNYDSFLNINVVNSITTEKMFLSNLLNTKIFDSEKNDGSKIDRQDKKFAIRYPTKSIEKINTLKFIPTIAMISDNINIFSRQSKGDLILAKEYFLPGINKNLNAYMRINSNGDAFIDANRVFIGSYDLFTQKDEKSSGNLKNSLIYLGASENNQSLVLGEQLKEYLTEIIDVHREDMDITKKLFLKVQNTFAKNNDKLVEEFKLKFQAINTIYNAQTTNPAIDAMAAIPPTAPVPGAQISAIFKLVFVLLENHSKNVLDLISSFDDNRKQTEKELKNLINSKKLKRNEDLSKRLEEIEKNIDKILSKVSKTS